MYAYQLRTINTIKFLLMRSKQNNCPNTPCVYDTEQILTNYLIFSHWRQIYTQNLHVWGNVFSHWRQIYTQNLHVWGNVVSSYGVSP